MKPYSQMMNELDEADGADEQEAIIDVVLERLMADGDPEAAAVIDFLLYQMESQAREAERLSSQ